MQESPAVEDNRIKAPRSKCNMHNISLPAEYDKFKKIQRQRRRDNRCNQIS